MKKYAKIENQETKAVSVGLGTNTEFYKSLGMNELDVEKGKDGRWYLTGYAPRQSFEEARTEKLDELNSAFTKASQTAHCMSSLGFEINADEIANRNIEGLTLVLKPGESTLFRAWDNRFHPVTKEQLETMRKEIIVHSQKLYQTKWQIEAAIDAAQTVEELNAITILFEPDISITPVAFTEQRNQSIYGSEVNNG